MVRQLGHLLRQINMSADCKDSPKYHKNSKASSWIQLLGLKAQIILGKKPALGENIQGGWQRRECRELSHRKQTLTWCKATCHEVHTSSRSNCFTLLQPQEHHRPSSQKLDAETHRPGQGLSRSPSPLCSLSDKETEDQRFDLHTVTRSWAPFSPLTQHRLFDSWGPSLYLWTKNGKGHSYCVYLLGMLEEGGWLKERFLTEGETRIWRRLTETNLLKKLLLWTFF